MAAFKNGEIEKVIHPADLQAQYLDAIRERYETNTYVRLLAPTSTVLVIEDEGKIVHPDYQRKGLGVILVGWGVKSADEEGVVCSFKNHIFLSADLLIADGTDQATATTIMTVYQRSRESVNKPALTPEVPSVAPAGIIRALFQNYLNGACDQRNGAVKIAYTASYLTSGAAKWFSPHIDEISGEIDFNTHTALMSGLKAAFDDPEARATAKRKLMKLKQGP
ncbi:hypothetical protein DFH27DRAFT_655409 [Peziza echinospora]|nr:hypothetical protein DFH27DRAFT_655409 [Peziza echinospora]